MVDTAKLASIAGILGASVDDLWPKTQSALRRRRVQVQVGRARAAA